MFSPLHNDVTGALEELRAQQDKIAAAVGKLDEVTATASSKDRTVTATVDGQGRLTDLDFQGRRWREMAPKELGAKIVEVVAEAQREAAGATNAVMAGIAPTGVDLDALRANGPDIESMITAAIDDLGRWTR